MGKLIVPAVRDYFRYAPAFLPKKMFWSIVATHFLGLEPTNTRIITETRFGSKLATTSWDILGRHVHYFGVWEPNLTYWIRSRLKPGDVFIDVGANVGYHSVLASELVGGSGKVVAVEPAPAIFSILEENLRLNHAANVRAVNCAAWDREETLTLYTEPEQLGVVTTAVAEWAEHWGLKNRVQVPAAPLDVILKPSEYRAARMIKVDVEGAEWQVLSGMASLIPEYGDDMEIALEATPAMLEASGRKAQDVLDLLKRWGFHPYSLDDSEASYFSPDRARPSRLIHAPQEQANVIFSRVDAEFL